MFFLTLDGTHINLQDATRIYTGRRDIDGRSCWVIIVRVGGVNHLLASTGENQLQAMFHCRALRQCTGNPPKSPFAKGEEPQQNGTL